MSEGEEEPSNKCPKERLYFENAIKIPCPELLECLKEKHEKYWQDISEARAHAEATGHPEVAHDQGKLEWEYNLYKVRREYDAALGAFSEKCYHQWKDESGKSGYEAFTEYVDTFGGPIIPRDRWSAEDFKDLLETPEKARKLGRAIRPTRDEEEKERR